MRIFISVLFVAAGIEVYLDVQHWKNREEKCGKSIPWGSTQQIRNIGLNTHIDTLKTTMFNEKSKKRM